MGHVSLMAVGCVRMVVARCAGIAFSRPVQDPDGDRVVLSATPGVAAGHTGGLVEAETLQILPGEEEETSSGLLDRAEVTAVVSLARRLEEHFSCPQDIEWAIDGTGKLILLQARPLLSFRPAPQAGVDAMAGQTPILSGGFLACSGTGEGPVVLVRPETDLAAFPQGGVLVARHSSPEFAQVMRRCAAIVTEVGTPTGHMASLSREFGVPTIVGLPGATITLRPGEPVTVIAAACCVYQGTGIFPRSPAAGFRPTPDSPSMERMRRVSRLMTPLHLTDPTSPEFSPQGCQSLHDLTRYVHEKVFEVMFHYGDQAALDQQNSCRLEARLPIVVRVFDLGGGVARGAGRSGRIRPGEITSLPMQAFLEGMLDGRIRWDQPRPISVRGFLSVLGESVAGPPAEALKVGRLSYAILSDRYLNFSTKAGYHFSTVDTYCGNSLNKNYIHFRFSGGAADPERRLRRIGCLSTILHALGFRVTTRGDLLTARLDKCGVVETQSRLSDLGRLTLCARQLDMLMDTPDSPGEFAQAFLTGEWAKF
jgi:pyruvate,water dikinase